MIKEKPNQTYQTAACFHLRPHLHAMPDGDGHPATPVPSEWLWDLVEYLSYHRLNLRYQFDREGFRMAFLCQTAAKAQQLLDDWAGLPGVATFTGAEP